MIVEIIDVSILERVFERVERRLEILSVLIRISVLQLLDTHKPVPFPTV
ncbi:hypothetical protein [Prauserella halophila]|nr:hypothetical protein [Prauserella halophila]